MELPNKKPKYPQNLPLKKMVQASGRPIKEIAEKIGYSRVALSLTVNGHYKGDNIVPKLKKEINKKQH